MALNNVLKTRNYWLDFPPFLLLNTLVKLLQATISCVFSIIIFFFSMSWQPDLVISNKEKHDEQISVLKALFNNLNES